MTTKTWVVEWCASGKQRGIFHIDTLDAVVESNVKLMAGINEADAWIPLAFYDSQEEAAHAVEKFRTLTENLTNCA